MFQMLSDEKGEAEAPRQKHSPIHKMSPISQGYGSFCLLDGWFFKTFRTDKTRKGLRGLICVEVPTEC